MDNQPAAAILSDIYKERKMIMEKAFAYICAASDAAPRLLKRYCRKVYELGYVPICPKLSEAQYLQPDNADEKKISTASPVRSWAGVVCWWCAGMKSATVCLLKLEPLKSEISSAPPLTALPKSRKRMRTAASKSAAFFLFQPVTGFANLQINVKPPNVVFRKNLEI